RVRRLALATYEEVRSLEDRMQEIERELESVIQEVPTLEALRKVPGIGVLTATAMYASVGNVHAFRSGRHLASWLGLTPREFSSGSRRRLGRISKRGDVYLRTLLVHGARAALAAAERRRKADLQLTRLQAWVPSKADQSHRNRAAVALANRWRGSFGLSGSTSVPSTATSCRRPRDPKGEAELARRTLPDSSA